MKKLFALLLVLLLGITLVGCKKAPDIYYYETVVLNPAFSVAAPYVQIVYHASDEARIKANVTEITDRLNERLQSLHRKFDPFTKDTMIDQVNRNAGIKAVTVDQEFIDVLKLAKQVSAHSKLWEQPLYDITIHPVWMKWDFLNQYYDPLREVEVTLPSETELQELLPLVDIDKVLIDEANLTVELKSTGMAIDLGSIVKGYAADEVRKILVEFNVTSALIDIGGNLLFLGAFKKEDPWSVKIQTPYINKYYDKEAYYIGSVGKLYNVSAVTSGIYERYIKDAEGTEYHHILNPETGYPVDNDLTAVTVFTSKSIEADAWSTTIFCLGLEAGLALVESDPELEALFITKDKEIILSSGIKANFTFNEAVSKHGYSWRQS